MTAASFTTRIARPPEVVFDQLADVTRNAEWSPGFAGAERTSPGPIDVGTTYDTTAKGIGRMRIRIEEYDRPSRLGFLAEAGTTTLTHRFTLAPEQNGHSTRMTQCIDVRPKGALRFLAPVMALMIKRTIQHNTEDLTRYLERSV